MPETVETQVQVSTEQTEQTQVAPTNVNPFAQQSWAETEPSPVTETQQQTQTETTNTETTATAQTQQAQVTEWFKNYGWENEDAAKAEIEQLKTLKEKPAQAEPIKYANEESEKVAKLLQDGKVDEVISIYNNQKRIEKAIALDVSNDTAAEIIKLNMQLKYPTLTQEQIDFQYRQEYGVSKEPIQKDTETDEDFSERHQVWKEQVQNAQMKAQIAATMAKPELEKAKAQIVLPEINPVPQQANQPDPEQLKQVRQNFLNKLESEFSKVEGFTTTVKDELVELPVSFKIPDDAKSTIKGKLAGDFNVEDFLTSRWFGNNAEPKIEQIMTDLYLLENVDKVLSGVANNAANQRLIEFRKQASNIDLGGNQQQNTFQPNQGGNQSVNPFSKGAWSDKPPAFVN